MVADALLARWAEQPDTAALLSLSRRSLRQCLHHAFTNPRGLLFNLLDRLTSASVDRGEWAAISHDATFKCTFSVIGQKPMAQKAHEIHTAHTFLGVTGGCRGFSLQAKEGNEAFSNAVQDLFTPDMINQVRLLLFRCP